MGNWKDVAPSIPATQRFFIDLNQALADLKRGEEQEIEPQVVIAPPFTSLLPAAEILKRPHYRGILLGAQDVHWTEPGKHFTGDIPAGALRNLGVKFCIIGHSERREYHGETNEEVNRKGRTLLDEGISPVVCVGETFKPQNPENPLDSDIETAWRFIEEQFAQSFLYRRSQQDVENSLVAYEPCWAIGTGLSAQPAYAEAICEHIRNRIEQGCGQNVAARVLILYGGSVNPKNITSFMVGPDIDGPLVGGASLDPTEFANIIRLGSGCISYRPPH